MSQIDSSRRSLGVTFDTDKTAHVVVWAPLASQLVIHLLESDTYLPLTKQTSGYWQTTTGQLKPGDLYTFILDDEKECADPVSLLQPQGVYGPSKAFDTNAFYWEDSCWINRPIDEYNTYELDIHTFTPEGTFDALVDKLAELKTLGVNAIVIRPASPFPDSRQGQPDGVFLYAVQAEYGGPAQLQHLINICHYEGIAVIVDLTYNQTAKQGELYQNANTYSTRRRHKPTRISAVPDEAQRGANGRYLVENALMWFRDFHVDALRLNDVYSLPDAEGILNDIREHANALTASTGRHHCLLVEYGLPPTTQEESGLSGPIHRTSEGYESYCFDATDRANHPKAYRGDFIYDKPFSTALRQFFDGTSRGASGGPFVMTYASSKTS